MPGKKKRDRFCISSSSFFTKAIFIFLVVGSLSPVLVLLIIQTFFPPRRVGTILRRGCEIGAGGKAFVGGRSDSKPMKMLSHVRNAAALL